MKDQEANKTLIFVLVAGMAGLVAWEPWRPSLSANSVPVEIGRKMFPDFTDPLAAKSLEVMRYDETKATLHPFKVAQHNGVWSIPSHSNYPADAAQHMAEAATALIGLEILGVESNSPGDQEVFGVVAPNEKIDVGMTGVGTQVTVKDDKDRVLADIVIGKEMKDQPGVRYVRRGDRDQIYRVAISPDKFSTKFEDWIEKDLLKLNAFDVRAVELSDYSSQARMMAGGQAGLAIDLRSKAKLAFDDATGKWSLVEMSQFDEKGEPSPVALAEDEELNNEKLNGMKTALDDLKIIDVERKPQGLSRDLRATDEFVKNMEAAESLLERGFFPAQRPGGPLEIFSSEGEATCTTKDGVRYILRFGGLAGGTEVSEDEEGNRSTQPSRNRYLFLMAQFDETQIPKPVFNPVPDEDAATATGVDATQSESDVSKPEAAAEAHEDAKPEAEAEAKPVEASGDGDVPETKTAAQEPVDDAQETKDDAPAEATSEGQADDETGTEESDAATQEEQAKDLTPEEERRIAIRRDNKRRQDEYDAAIKQGQDKVKELNDRFADWYFVISDDVYQKIHLDRGDIIKKRAGEEGDAAGTPAPTSSLLPIDGTIDGN